MTLMVVSVALIAAGMVLLLLQQPLPALPLVLYGGGNGLLTIARGALPLVALAIALAAVVLAKLLDRSERSDEPENALAELVRDETESMHERLDRLERILREQEAAAAEDRAMMKQLSARLADREATRGL